MYATNTEHCSYMLNNAHCNEEHMMLNITCSRLCTYAHTRKKMEEGMIVLFSGIEKQLNCAKTKF